ncbi:MAG: DISARM system SNF2-like helicase DrmD [Nanoarchaeota archaeon]|nr:DISARM system SNF2-like helicase DrmD [Nanoarchaeota archaeon]
MSGSDMSESITTLEQGQLVIVRRRPAIVREIKSFEDEFTKETQNILNVEYIDGWNFPLEDNIIWERERGAKILSSVTLPDVSGTNSKPDPPERFHAFLDAIKWSTQGKIANLIDLPEEYGSINVTSPWKSAVEVEDYQIYPVLKAMSMPRVSLLLADDVGVGKTIEAGLIASELISQRRIRRILIICPASIQEQWKDEMRDKFNLDFVIMNSSKIFEIQKSLGMDANPWTTSPRIITSMDYLRQQDIINRFGAGAVRLQPEGSAVLPWDLLIVDEAHHLSPSRFGDDSLRCQMLREISKYFEHRLFLTATPHNGFTVSFTGLLEMLDPLRFRQKTSLDEKDYAQIQTSVVRRLKSELNKNRAIPRFVKRNVEGISLKLSDKEKNLFEALRRYREEGIKIVSKEGKREKNLGQFIFSILTKRLLSSSYAFARTWWNHIAGFGLEDFGLEEAERSRKRAETPVSEDDEKERRESDAMRHGAGWLRKFSKELETLFLDVSSKLKDIGWTEEIIKKGIEDIKQFPPDKKWEELNDWIKKHLLTGDKFRTDERLIIFTEYKDTLDYLILRFKEEMDWVEPTIQTLFGGVPEIHRSMIKREFNDPQTPLRILVATDVAAEGLNLQTSCRYVVHQEIPWNPMRLEQRNGRVDRYGQGRDVTVFHFTSDDDADIKFLSYVANKVTQVREDLGSVGQVLDEAVMEHFSGHRIETKDIDQRLEQTNKYASEKQDLNGRDRGTEDDYEKSIRHFQTTELQMGFNEKNLARLLSQALQMENGSIKEEGSGVYRIDKIPPSWEKLITSSLKIQREELHGALPKIVFDPKYFEIIENKRPIFRPKNDTVLLRLGHPIMQKAIAVLRKQLWDESGDIRRWTLLQAKLPQGIDIVSCLSCTINVRNKLGEIAHAMVVEIPLILTKAGVKDIEPDLWKEIERLETQRLNEDQINIWRPIIHECWLKGVDSIKRKIDELKEKTENDFKKSFSRTFKEQQKSESKIFEQRIQELEVEKNPRTLERLRKELSKAEEQALQLTFSEERNLERRMRAREFREKVSDAEWERQHTQVKILKQRLEDEKERILGQVLPNRFSLASVDVQPVAVKTLVRQGGVST